MRYSYIDVSEKKWINVVVNIIIVPFAFITWLLKIILKSLTKIFIDVFGGVYKKMIKILVFLAVILILAIIAGLINQPWIKNLVFIK